jgi:hypothetical protein
VYDAEGGHARVAIGNTLGIVPPVFKNEELMISSNVGLLNGSKFRILVISYLAASEIGTLSGNPY